MHSLREDETCRIRCGWRHCGVGAVACYVTVFFCHCYVSLVFLVIMSYYLRVWLRFGPFCVLDLLSLT